MARRKRLSAGMPTGCAVIALPVVLFIALVWAFLVFLAVDQTRRFVTGGDFGLGGVLTFLLLAVILLVVIYFVGAIGVTYLRIARERVWLKGSFLIERRIVRRRRVDLRSATVELRLNPDDYGLLLAATDPRSGRSIRLPLQAGRRNLPASELTALADAILDEPGNARRAGDDQTAAIVVADRLRRLLDAPWTSGDGRAAEQRRAGDQHDPDRLAGHPIEREHDHREHQPGPEGDGRRGPEG
jgi:hypothetical protein